PGAPRAPALIAPRHGSVSSRVAEPTPMSSRPGVIREPSAPYNARSCRGRWPRRPPKGPKRPLWLPSCCQTGGGLVVAPATMCRWRCAHALVVDKCECGAVLIAGGMLDAGALAPDAAVDRREQRVAIGPGMHACDEQAVGMRHGLRIDLRAADHHDGAHPTPQRIAACGGESCREARSDNHVRCSESTIARDHDDGAPLERPGQRLER